MYRCTGKSLRKTDLPDYPNPNSLIVVKGPRESGDQDKKRGKDKVSETVKGVEKWKEDCPRLSYLS